MNLWRIVDAVAVVAFLALVTVVLSVTIPTRISQEERKAQTVLIETEEAWGSGELFTRNGVTYVWTAGHVSVKSPHMTLADLFSGKPPVFLPATNILIHLDGRTYQASCVARGFLPEKKDVALLRIWDDVPNTPSVKFTDDLPEPGAPLTLLGNYHGQFLPNFETSGQSIAGLQLTPEGIFAITTAPCGFGMSGGGAYNDKGECLGIISRISGDGDYSLTEYVPTAEIRRWARKAGVEWAMDYNVPMPQ